MFAASRLTRNSFKSIVSPENITRIVNKAMEAPSSIPKAKPIPYGLRAKDGSYIPIRNKDEFIKVASEHPDFKQKVFAGASMKHLDIPRFNSHTLRHVAVAFIIAIGGAMAYKIHNNAYMRDVRAGMFFFYPNLTSFFFHLRKCHNSLFFPRVFPI